MRTALIRMRSDSPPFDDVKKGERHLRDFWAIMCFYILGCVFMYLEYVDMYILMLVDLFV